MSSPTKNAAAPVFLNDEAAATKSSTPTPSAQSVGFIEDQYALYLNDRGSVSPDWREYFDDMHAGEGQAELNSLQLPFPAKSIFHHKGAVSAEATSERATDNVVYQERLDQLVRNYRVRGHIAAEIDPLNAARPRPPELDPEFYGFTAEHMDMVFSTEMVGGAEQRTLSEIIDWLQATYCRSIGVQFMHIDSLQVRSWLLERMEKSANRISLSREEQVRILRRLCDAVTFEEFVQRKYVGAKSFSLEGAESLIPLLDMTIEHAGTQGIELIVLGMAHRGRLNILSNIMGKHASQVFREFEDRDLQIQRGDVKYHLGYSSDWQTAAGEEVHLTLCFNPSHLEYVNPVALGRLRGKQDHVGDYQRRNSMGILIHGDAAFAGEGVVQETLNLSELSGYRTGGTLHIVVNNQIGFTTSASDGRSCTYATDVARMLQIPIFHVNGENPEAVAQVVKLAMDFREKFQRDVIIDMYCFRRRGHNEGDEPAFTQPTMYEVIRHRKTVFESYLEGLLALDEVTREEADEILERRGELLERELAKARNGDFSVTEDARGNTWSDFFGGPVDQADQPDTRIEAEEFHGFMRQVFTPPEEFTPHPRLKRLIATRQNMLKGEAPFDWGAAEMAALASVVAEGRQLRFTGQDIRRGTFSHRHAVLFDSKTGQAWSGIETIAERPELVELYNSPLSEIGVLGFEYGYSLDQPAGLTIWEAQFGDFANAAQVIIDQFISSAEDKWGRLSGLVMLLPHGFEGQGPEHSSARVERFLTLAAEDNMQIAVPSTPAQYFHLLRRQSLRKWRKPLVVMTPKSLLRHKKAVSEIAELTEGKFDEVVADEQVIDGVKRILLCSGKIYYELDAARVEQDRKDIAIIRLEQLYPLPIEQLSKCLAAYPETVPVTWVQEEPANMGALGFLKLRLGQSIAGHPFNCVSRPESASPATGSHSSHEIEQQRVLQEAFESNE